MVTYEIDDDATKLPGAARLLFDVRCFDVPIECQAKLCS